MIAIDDFGLLTAAIRSGDQLSVALNIRRINVTSLPLLLQHNLIYAAVCPTVNESILDMLLDAGIHIDVAEPNKESCLMHSCANGHTHNIELLLKRGANPNLSTPTWSPLIISVFNQAWENIEVLIKYGAKDTPNRDGVTAYKLLKNTYVDYPEILKMLEQSHTQVVDSD